jgi:hypothetical protein
MRVQRLFALIVLSGGLAFQGRPSADRHAAGAACFRKTWPSLSPLTLSALLMAVRR